MKFLSLDERKKISLLLFLGALAGLLFLFFLNYSLPPAPLPCFDEMRAAARLMDDCSRQIKFERERLGFSLVRRYDINATGLIGEELSSITTTLGSIEAKRTAAAPDFAALMVRLFYEADLRPGDTIGIGASGSFPGGVIAALCAAEVMNLNVVAVFSLGASNWGANLPEFTVLDMYGVVEDRLPLKAAAVSLGGLLDTGSDLGMDLIEGGRSLMLEKMFDSGCPYILEARLEDSVARRLEFYAAGAGPEGLTAFVNIGGADANIGEGLWSLELRPGINRRPAPAGRGLAEGGCISAFLDKGLPVIHILNIKSLSLSYGLTYDPFPLAEPGTEALYYNKSTSSRRLTLALGGAIYILISAAILLYIKKKSSLS